MVHVLVILSCWSEPSFHPIKCHFISIQYKLTHFIWIFSYYKEAGTLCLTDLLIIIDTGSDQWTVTIVISKQGPRVLMTSTKMYHHKPGCAWLLLLGAINSKYSTVQYSTVQYHHPGYLLGAINSEFEVGILLIFALGSFLQKQSNEREASKQLSWNM